MTTLKERLIAATGFHPEDLKGCETREELKTCLEGWWAFGANEAHYYQYMQTADEAIAVLASLPD